MRDKRHAYTCCHTACDVMSSPAVPGNCMVLHALLIACNDANDGDDTDAVGMDELLEPIPPEDMFSRMSDSQT